MKASNTVKSYAVLLVVCLMAGGTPVFVNRYLVTSLFTVLGLLPVTALAGALYFQEMSSASESGYAGAGMTARANDPGTAFSNPAGMTRVKQPKMMAGAIGVFIPAGFSSDIENLTAIKWDRKSAC